MGSPGQTPEPETATTVQPEPAPLLPSHGPEPEEPYRGLRWMFIGPEGLRAGWSVALFIGLFIIFADGLNYVLNLAHLNPSKGTFAPGVAFVGEVSQLLLLLLIVFILSRVERRRLAEYNLLGPRRLPRFSIGLITGFAALSLLVAGLSVGGWMHFGPVALSGGQIFLYAAEWGAVFLLVGCFEEGFARCYLLYTLARGLNFWWGAGLVAGTCLLVSLNPKANGLWGAYAAALLGLIPCLWLQLAKAPSTGFWNAAWVTSVMFGALHTANKGENWIGIFAAAAIGFVFCASVKLTGSAWWAIGCHASWDWAESYFYGTADSGMVAKGHLLSASPAGNVLWSGGAVGPEGSALVLAICVLLMALLLLVYGRKRTAAQAAPAEHSAAG